MSVTFPFKCTMKTNRQQKITSDEELTFYTNAKDTLNNLISRFNSAAPASIPSISVVTTASKGAPLTATDYDSNMSAFESRINAMIVAGAALGFNSSNQMSLNKTSDFENPITTGQRDQNVATIQIFINTAQQLFLMAGI